LLSHSTCPPPCYIRFFHYYVHFKLIHVQMNLASRCREAISSVAMLKKELSAQQRRTAEAVALQQQQQRQSELVKSVIVNAAAAAAASAATANSKSPANTKIAVADALAAVPSSPAVESNKVVVTTPTSSVPSAIATPTATPTNGKSPANKQVVSVTAKASPAAHDDVAVPTANGTVIGSSTKRNLTVDVEAEMELMDLIVAAHTPTTSANSSPIPPQYGHARPAPALPSVHDNTDRSTNSSINAKQTNDNDDDDDQDNVMMEAETILSIKPIKTASTGTVTSSSYYTPPESPAKGSVREGTDDDDDDDYSEPDVEVYQELEEQHITDSKTSPTVVTSIVAGRQDLRKSTTSPILDDSASEMRCDSPGQSCGTGYAGTIKKENYNEEYPGDISVVRQQSSGRRRPSKLDGVELLGDFKEADDETSVNSGTSSQVAATFERKQAAADDKSTMSSIDAFEASFKTDFPESFSPRDATVEEKKTSDSGIYNPFFPSPAKKSPRETASTSSSDRPWANSPRDRSSVASRRMEHRRNAGGASVNGHKLPSPKAGTPPASPATSGKLAAAAKAPFSASGSPVAKPSPSPSGASPLPIALPSSPAIHHYSPSTTQESPRNATRAFRAPPPLEGSRTPSPEKSKSSEGPSRPEKTGYDAARSRYEKALKPRDPGHKFKEPDELLLLSSTEPTTATLPNAMITNAVVTNAVDSHLGVMNPVVAYPVITHPVVTHPVVTHPVVTHPVATKPVATKPVVSNATVPNVRVSNEASQQPSVRARAAIFSDTSPRAQEKPVVFRGSWVAQAAEEPSSPLPSSPTDDGDIPMNSNLSAKKPQRQSRAASSSPVRNMGNGSEHSGSASVNEIDDARTRLRPWDSASASASQLNEGREFDQSQIDATSSPIGASRFTLSGKQSRTVKDLPPEEYQYVSARYRRGEAFRPNTDAAGIGPR
jgi:hypothetical protein